MKKAAGILGASLTGVSMLAWLASAAAAGTSAGANKWRLGAGGAPVAATTEPISIALLSAGLLAMGLFAKIKNRKKG